MSVLGLVLVSGAAGSFLGRWLRLPSGWLLGAIGGASLATVLLGRAEVPGEVSLTLQIMAGTMLGANMDASLVRRLWRIGPSSVLGLGVVAAATWLVPALLLWVGASLGLEQAAVGAAPAGSAVALLANQQGIDPASVSALTVARIVAVLMVLPAVLALAALLSRLG